MLTLSWLVFDSCCIIGLINLRRARRSVALLESQWHKRFELPLHPPHFVVLVPLLRKQAVVRSLIERMARRECGATWTTREYAPRAAG